MVMGGRQWASTAKQSLVTLKLHKRVELLPTVAMQLQRETVYWNVITGLDTNTGTSLECHRSHFSAYEYFLWESP